MRILTQKFCYSTKHGKGSRLNISPPQSKFREKCFDFVYEVTHYLVFSLQTLV